jgi:predicted deacetylase
MIDNIPTIKINLFTSPYYQKHSLIENKEWCDEVRQLIDSNNIRLCMHGYSHIPTDEFKWLNYKQTLSALNESESIFIQSNLPFLKVFKGPGWGINENTYKVLIEKKYTHIYINEHWDNLQYECYSNKIKHISYNWNLKDNAPNNKDIVAHGHCWNVCDNGIEQTCSKLLTYLHNNKNIIEFKFADEI